MVNPIDRRAFVVGTLASLAMSAHGQANRKGWYIGTIPDQPFNIPRVDQSRIRAQFHRRTVVYSGTEPPGTILIDKPRFHLLRVGRGGTAVRYGIAVGRDGQRWHGEAVVGRKAAWPSWTPTANMRRRNPSLPVRMPGGPQNPLGARALYLYRDGRDTLYRIHGTNEPWSIGHAASSGCIRMLNEHIVEVFNETPQGARVIVL
jgi:lipoprotein-anchoring transpeptidase ErfK/SrfK